MTEYQRAALAKAEYERLEAEFNHLRTIELWERFDWHDISRQIRSHLPALRKRFAPGQLDEADFDDIHQETMSEVAVKLEIFGENYLDAPADVDEYTAVPEDGLDDGHFTDAFARPSFDYLYYLDDVDDLDSVIKQLTRRNLRRFAKQKARHVRRYRKGVSTWTIDPLVQEDALSDAEELSKTRQLFESIKMNDVQAAVVETVIANIYGFGKRGFFLDVQEQLPPEFRNFPSYAIRRAWHSVCKKIYKLTGRQPVKPERRKPRPMWPFGMLKFVRPDLQERQGAPSSPP